MPEGSSVRWQSITIQQLGFSINLILALATAVLGFAVSLLKECAFQPSGTSKWTFDSAVLLFVVSIGLGIWCTINRVCDFRLTTATARLREKLALDGKPKHEIDGQLLARRQRARSLGAWTWRLFYCQLGAFSLAVLLLIFSVSSIYGAKLF